MQCFSPICIRNPNYGKFYMFGKNTRDPYLFVPCGRCLACLSRRSSMWTSRLVIESKHSAVTWFVTLTYDDSCVPVLHAPDVDTVHRGMFSDIDTTPVLVKKDFQDFLKRFRSKLDIKCKYYACGEYGSQTYRPHFHMILFLKDIMDRDHLAEVLGSSWPNGFVRIDDCSPAAMRYVTKYVCKDTEDSYLDFLCQLGFPQFALMSKGLGGDYLDDSKYFHCGPDPVSSCFFVNDDGTKSVLPRYWKDKIYSDGQKKKIADFYRDKYCAPYYKSDGTFDYRKARNILEEKKMATFLHRNKLDKKRNKL